MDFNWLFFGLILNFVIFFVSAWKKSVWSVFDSSTSENNLSNWMW